MHNLYDLGTFSKNIEIKDFGQTQTRWIGWICNLNFISLNENINNLVNSISLVKKKLSNGNNLLTYS